MVSRRLLSALGYATSTIGIIMLVLSVLTLFTMRDRAAEQSLRVISTLHGPLEGYVLHLLLAGMLFLGLACYLLLLSRRP